MMEFHKLVADSWHPIHLWHELKFWQQAKHLYTDMEENGLFSYAEEIVNCDYYIDMYCDFIEQRVYTLPEYHWGYNRYGFSVGYFPIDK